MIIKENGIAGEIFERLKKEIFIYPTDTIYGIGCDATDKKLVGEIRKIKKRTKKPFSVIAPSKKWILKNFKVNKEYLDKYLPGAYTLILEKKKKNFLNWISDNNFVGVRIPLHRFTKVLQKLKFPIVTTSVNISGERFANSVKELDKRILKKVYLIIDGGRLSGKPSTLIKGGKVIKRK
jgi:L-threonylcarbamoyladenylate synthase